MQKAAIVKPFEYVVNMIVLYQKKLVDCNLKLFFIFFSYKMLLRTLLSPVYKSAAKPS